MLQKEMIEAGEKFSSDLMDAQMSQCMGTMGGHTIKNISEYNNSDLIQKCLDNEMVSVEATYIAMRRAEKLARLSKQVGKCTIQEAVDIMERDSLVYNYEAWKTLKAATLAQQEGLPCPYSGGDCNRESPYVDEFGEWTKFKEVVVIYSNSLHQIKTQIDALIEEFCELYDGDLSNEAVSLLLTELRKLSAGLAVCEFKTKE